MPTTRQLAAEFISSQVDESSDDMVLQMTYMIKKAMESDTNSVRQFLQNETVQQTASTDCQFGKIVVTISAIAGLKEDALFC